MREGLGERGRSGVPRYAASRPGYFFRHAPPVEAPQMPPRPHPVRSRPRPSELSSFLSSRGRAAWSTAAARRPWTAARTGLGGRWHSWRCRPNTCTHTHTRLDLACGRGRVGGAPSQRARDLLRDQSIPVGIPVLSESIPVLSESAPPARTIHTFYSTGKIACRGVASAPVPALLVANVYTRRLNHRERTEGNPEPRGGIQF